MHNLKMPNIRNILVPDPDYTLIEADLKGADARVVAWEAGDEKLKQAFREDIDIHAFNARDIWQKPNPLIDYKNDPLLKPLRQRAKVAIHAVDYVCKARTLAAHINVTTVEAERFINAWLEVLHPQIGDWHRRVDKDLRTKHAVTNIWGYTITFLDRVEDLLPEAVAWIGQSTTAIAINKLIVKLANEVPEAQILHQNHDSVLFQVKTTDLSTLWPRIKTACTVTCPYPDPLVMPVEFKKSAKSWGDVKEFDFA